MKIEVITSNRLALGSKEYQVLADDQSAICGSNADNSKNFIFNFLLMALFKRREVSVLDLGCSGGGFIEDCIAFGGLGVGLEGTDFSLCKQRAAWETIPNNLFCADISKPFLVLVNGRPRKFDVITSWEVLEHIPEENLYGVCENVQKHLETGGLWINSISSEPGEYHITVNDRDWWINYFEKQGFKNNEDLVKYFGSNWIRGPEQKAPGSFHLCLRLN